MRVEYSFYDHETGGMLEKGGHEEREPALQLAIVGCGADFKELKALNLWARRKPDYVPTLGACATTGISPHTADTYPTSEYDMARETVRYMQHHPGTIWIAWNDKFDIPIMRHRHFRSLYPATPTSMYGNSCVDAMKIAKAIYCFASASTMRFPERQKFGSKLPTSLKLTNVAKANGVALIGAHDGLNDTRALPPLCKVMKETSPDVWEHMLELRHTEGVNSFLMQHNVFLWTTPDATTYQTLPCCYVAHKGQGLLKDHSPNLQTKAKEILIANLAVDPATWVNRSDRELLLILKGRDPDNPQEFLPHSHQPFRVVKINRQPILWPYMDDPCEIPGDVTRTFTERERAVSACRTPALTTLSRAELERRAGLIKTNTALCDRLSVLHERMWQVWDRDKNKWVEPDRGVKTGDDFIYDNIGLNLPSSQNHLLRSYLGLFHTEPWHQREAVVERIGQIVPRPDRQLEQTNPAEFEQQQRQFEYMLALKRFGMITLYEQELVHNCPGAYLKAPKHRHWVEKYYYRRLTEPCLDSKGQPMRKPKYRTLEDTERLAAADIKAFETKRAQLQKAGQLTPDLAEEFEHKLEMGFICQTYYEDLRERLEEPVLQNPASGEPFKLPRFVIRPGDLTPANAIPVEAAQPIPAPAPQPVPAPSPAFAVASKLAKAPPKKPKPGKKSGKAPAKTLVTKAVEQVTAHSTSQQIQGRLFGANGGKARNAFSPMAQRSPTVALNAQTQRKKGSKPATPQTAKTKTSVKPPARSKGPKGPK